MVTGSAGFIGMHTTVKLLELGHQVVGLDNLNDYYDVNLKYGRLKSLGFKEETFEYGRLVQAAPELAFIKLDLEDGEAVKRLFGEQRFDYAINLAAQAGVRYSLTNPHAYIESNITGFLNLLEACRAYPVKHLVYASSSSVYGLNKKIPFTEGRPADHPVSLYAASKKSNEMMAHTYSHLFDIPTSGLRFFTVYGPYGRPDMALFIFTKNILEGKPIEVFNHGDMQRDFTYIDDIVGGVTALLDKAPARNNDVDFLEPASDVSSAPYRIYNIGASAPVQLMDFVRAIEEKLGKKADIIFKPLQAGDVQMTYADTTNLEEVTGYKPSTSVKDGIDRFIDWFRDFYGV